MPLLGWLTTLWTSLPGWGFARSEKSGQSRRIEEALKSWQQWSA